MPPKARQSELDSLGICVFNSELKLHMTMSDWWGLCHMMMPWVQGMLGN